MLGKVCSFEPLCEFVRSRGNHPQQVLGTSCFLCLVGKLLVPQLRLHRQTNSHLALLSQTPGQEDAHTTGLNTFELILNSRTVTAILCITPGNDGSVFQNRSKRPKCGLNLLQTPELISNCRTVTAILCITPGHD